MTKARKRAECLLMILLSLFVLLAYYIILRG